MSEEATSPQPRAGSMRRWRQSANAVRLPKEQTERQGAITHLAFQLLGRDAALDFLNGEHIELGGRPLDLAMASADGFVAVELIMRRRAAAP
jgi:hypothetical protein